MGSNSNESDERNERKQDVIMARLRAFFAFWYDFVIGDDWHVAVGIVAALAATYGISRAGVPAWWLVPVAVAFLLPYSLWRVTRESTGVTSAPKADLARVSSDDLADE